MNRTPVLVGLAALSAGSMLVGVVASTGAAATGSTRSRISGPTSVARQVSVHASPIAFSAVADGARSGVDPRLGVLPRTGALLVSAPAIFVPGRALRTRYLTSYAYRRIAFSAAHVADSALYVGTTRVAQYGRSGWLRITYVRTVRGSHLQSFRLVRRTVTRAPRTLIIEFGTRHHVVVRRVSPPPVARTGGYPGVPAWVSALSWSSLAWCESGGNARSAGNGFYGLYQFSVWTWEGVGGSGLPSNASAAEQTYRAQLLFERRGRAPWPYCGQFL